MSRHFIKYIQIDRDCDNITNNHSYKCKFFLITLVKAVEKFNGLLGLLLLGCSSLEPGPPGLEPLLPLPDPLVGGLTGLVTGLEASDSSAEVLRDVG